MPDQFGFDHLGSKVRCIEDGCGYGGYVFEIRERERERHHDRHVKDEALKREKARRKQAKANLATARREKALERRIAGSST